MDSNKTRRKADDDFPKAEVFIRKEVMLQPHARKWFLPHEWLKLLGIMNEIQRARIKAQKKNGPRCISVPKLNKTILNRLIRSGYTVNLVYPKSNKSIKWYEISF